MGRALRAACVVALVGLLAFCASPRERLAPEAEAFYSSMHEAGRERVGNLARFVPPDGVLDASSIYGRVLESRADQMDYLRRWYGPALDEVYLQAVYVDAKRSLARYVYRPSGQAPAGGVWMTLDEIGPTGLVHRTMLMSSCGDDWVVESPVYAQAERTAARHRHVWTTGLAEDVAGLYAPQARVVDTLAGVDLNGREAIARAAAQQAQRQHWSPAVIEPASAQPVFLHRGDPYSAPLSAVVHLMVDTESTQTQAVLLVLDSDGLVVEDRRFHPADSTVTGAEPVATWWHGLTLPPTVDESAAERLTTVHGPVLLRGGDDAVRQTLRWALGRFTVAGLDQPHVRAVTVDPYGEACEGVSGFVVLQESTCSLTLCHDEASICADEFCTSSHPMARQSVLHELSHAWLEQNLSPGEQLQFVHLVGLDTWDDPDVAWDRRGQEWAAEILAWGLMDELVALHRIGDPPQAELVEAFRVLAGTDPLRGAGTQDHGPVPG